MAIETIIYRRIIYKRSDDIANKLIYGPKSYRNRKTSKVVTGDSKMVDLKPARLEVYNAKFSDFLGEIKRNNKYQKKEPYSGER